MASRTLLVYLAVLCLLQYSVAEGTELRDFLSRRHIDRREATSVEEVKARSEQLKSRMSNVIQQVESEVQQRSQDIAKGLEDALGRVIDAGARMMVERIEAEAAEKSSSQATQ